MAAIDLLDQAPPTVVPAVNPRLICVGWWCPDCEAEDLEFVGDGPSEIHATFCPSGGADVEAVYRMAPT